MGIHSEVKPGEVTFRRTAEIVVSQVVDNYMFKPNTISTQLNIHADIVGVLNILWKGIEFRVSPSFNSYTMSFDFRLELGENDPLFFSVIYSWDNSDF